MLLKHVVDFSPGFFLKGDEMQFDRKHVLLKWVGSTSLSFFSGKICH